MEQIFETIKQFIIEYGLLAVFTVGFLEEIIFAIPSTLVFLGAGFFLIDPSLSLGWDLFYRVMQIAFWGSMGVTIGSFFIYGIFYYGGKVAIDKYGRYLGISWGSINKLQQKFSQGWADEIVFVFLRSMPIWSMTVISAFAGLVRWSWKKFGIYTFIGTSVRFIILLFLGWKFGSAYRFLASRLEEIYFYGTIILLVSLIVLLVFVFRKKKA